MGDQVKTAEKMPIVFSAFFLSFMSSNFERLQNYKSSLSWKFQNSILKNAKTSQFLAPMCNIMMNEKKKKKIKNI